MSRFSTLLPSGLRYPQDFNTYYLGKMTRSGIPLDVHKRNGLVWYTPQKGLALMKTEVAKMTEELIEVIKAHHAHKFKPTEITHQHRVEELGDVVGVITQMAETIAPPFISKAGNLNMVLATWSESALAKVMATANRSRTLKPYMEDALAYTVNSILRYLKAQAISQAELDAAIAAKNAAKGTMLHGRTEFIALPKADTDWNPYFSQSFATVPTATLNLASAWNFERPMT